jgi:predicted Fe-Mo cluster-binding NifX family protein
MVFRPFDSLKLSAETGISKGRFRKTGNRLSKESQIMKIAATANEPSLDAPLDPRFGRCRYFLFADSDNEGSFEAVENPNAAFSGGAGIQSAQIIAEKGAETLLTGNCGPNAFRTLTAAGVQVIVGCSGTVRKVLEKYQSGELQAASEPNVAEHSGTGDQAPQDQCAPPSGTKDIEQPVGRGEGMGQGRGMGGGGGRGRGRGMGRGRGARGGRGRGGR